MKRILVIPHMGTASGHVIRTAEFVNQFFNHGQDVFFVLPRSAVSALNKHLPSGIRIIERKVHCSICSKSGYLDKKKYLSLLSENKAIVDTVRPDLIVGDPGIQASILSCSFQIPWIGIMHGCYLPIPMFTISKSDTVQGLMSRAWSVINRHLDDLVSTGTDCMYTAWSDIRKTGTVVVPNDLNNLYEEDWIFLKDSIESIGWAKHPPVEFLITCCSAGTSRPSSSFISRLGKYVGSITIAGSNVDSRSYGHTVNIIGNQFSYRTLASNNTVVLTHGGQGTLNAIGSAGRVLIMPTDLDQLCNALIYNLAKGWRLVFDRNWFEVLSEANPFKRYANWGKIDVRGIDESVELGGVKQMYVDNVDEIVQQAV